MRVWTVEGADVANGVPRKVMVRAQDEGEASRLARLQGVLTSTVYMYNPAADDDRLEELGAIVATASKRSKNDQSQISDVQGRLNAADFILSILGWLYIAGSALFLLVAIVATLVSTVAKPPFEMIALPAAIIGAVVGVGFGTLLLGLGAAFRMLGIIGASERR